jgi:hypothetical protein
MAAELTVVFEMQVAPSSLFRAVRHNRSWRNMVLRGVAIPII